MEIIKRKILLENFVSRTPGPTYGTITATTVNLNIPLYQEIKDLGMVKDLPTIKYDGSSADYTLLINKLNNIQTINTTTFNFVKNPTDNFTNDKTIYSPDTRYVDKFIEEYFIYGNDVSGITEDRLQNVYSYGFDDNDRFIVNRDVELNTYTNFLGKEVDGVNRVISNDDLNPITYTEDGDLNDTNFGSTVPPYQLNGLLFQTFTGSSVQFGEEASIPLTNIYYKSQGLNNTNVGLSGFTREEYLLYITQEPKVESDVFIDRGVTSVLPSHTQLAEINSLEQLEKFGNGFYNLIKI